jgi:hypothetical protein
MTRPMVILALVAGLVVLTGRPPLAAEPGAAGGGLLGDVPGLEGRLDPPAGEVLAEGPGGTLTEGGVAAFVEALEFCLSELGRPASLDEATRREIEERFAASFPRLPVDEQRFLANAAEIWGKYRHDWPELGATARREFMLVVLTFAFGPEAAGQALGIQ